MIRYALKCPDGHVFDSWFKSAAAFDALRGQGHVSCPECGATQIEKSLMAPRVVADGSRDTTAEIAKIRRHVEENATYVGGSFAQKAREMHEGTAPDTAIYGEASGAQARKLIEDGVPVLPLPFKPKQKLQ